MSHSQSHSLSLNTLLEVNGSRCSIDSEVVSCLRRRDRVDKKSEEATFVSTDSIRLTGSVKFEVFDKDDLVLSGVLEMSNVNGSIWGSKNMARWSMDCESTMSASAAFLKGKQLKGADSLSPTIEVYVLGCFSEIPIILNKTLHLSHRKKQRKGMLDAIPENENSEPHQDAKSSLDHLQVAEYRNYKSESEEDYNDLRLETDCIYRRRRWGTLLVQRGSEDGCCHRPRHLLGSWNQGRTPSPYLPGDHAKLQKAAFVA